MTKLSAMARKTQFFGDLLRANNAIPKGEEVFYTNKNDAIKELPNQEIVLLDDYLKDAPGVINPLKGSFTTKDIAEGIGNSNNVSAFFRGLKDKEHLYQKNSNLGI